MNSLHARLLLAASLVLAAFLAVAAVALERAYRESALAAQEEKLQSQVYALLAAAEVAEGGRMKLPRHLPEPRLSRPDSGLLAWVLDGRGKLFWHSASLLGKPPLKTRPLPAGRRSFHSRDGWFLLSFGVEWEDDQGRGWPYTFVVAERRTAFDQAAARFRATLWRWLGGLAAGLLLAQLLVLRWGLAPLRQAARELDLVREGKKAQLAPGRPAELRPLAEALDRLLAHERAARERYRNSLDDLAHSLKTPLAHLQGLAEDGRVACDELRRTTLEETARMDAIVRAQLARAAASGRSALAGPVPVEPLAERLVRALQKVYGEKGMAVELRIDAGARFRGDEGDLMELLGNLLDNAFKYGRGRVRVHAGCDGGLCLVVEDDGPGIPPEARRRVLERGTRLDEREEGEGLGLASVAEVVRLYEGELAFGESGLGGARVEVRLPGCGSG